jgi:hypothetical protein
MQTETVRAENMVAGMLILVILALGALALFSRRAVIGGIAAGPISDRVRQAAGLDSLGVCAADFGALISLHAAAAGLSNTGAGVGLVRAYYVSVLAISSALPGLAAWSEREMTTCSRYIGVLVDRSLEHNAACIRDARSR